MVYVQPALATPIDEHASMACRAVLPYSKRLCLVSFLKQERNHFNIYYFVGGIISILIVIFCGGCFLQSSRFRPNRRPLKTHVPVLSIALHLMQREEFDHLFSSILNRFLHSSPLPSRHSTHLMRESSNGHEDGDPLRCIMHQEGEARAIGDGLLRWFGGSGWKRRGCAY